MTLIAKVYRHMSERQAGGTSVDMVDILVDMVMLRQ